jgi:RNA polymerase sigma-70 factor (ECF subfamily)
MTDATHELRASWKRFLDGYAPLRGALYRYCRHLTRSPWDAEDLAQETLARAFVTLAQLGAEPPNVQAWLFRVASNLWIDQMRRAGRPFGSLGHGPEAQVSADPQEVREAAGTLIARLSPQERAALVLKDVFDYSLEEIAEVLVTTPGAIKAALHRGRGRLQAEGEAAEARETVVAAPARAAVLDAFCAAFNARDLDRVTALLTETAVVEVVGASTHYGREAARRTVLPGMMFGSERMATSAETGIGLEPQYVRNVLPVPARLEVVRHRGEDLILSWYAHGQGHGDAGQGGAQDGGVVEAVRAVNRLEVSEDGSEITRLANYFFNPEFIAELCEELAVPYRINGHTYC